MKILLFTVQYPPLIGGVPNFYYHLSKYLSENEIVIFTAKRDGAKIVDKDLSFPIYRTKFLKDYKIEYKFSFALINIPIFFHLLRIILREKINIIIVGQSDITLLLMCYIVKLILKKDYIIFLHGDGDSPDIRLKSDRLKQYLYERSKVFIVNSLFTKRRLLSKYSISSEKVFILYPGVDTKMFYPICSADLKNELHLSNRKILLTVGRLDKRKGHDMVIRALPKIVSEIPSIVYIIVGEGDQKEILDNLTKELNVKDYVQFIRYVCDEDLAKFYNLCDLFIMANRELDDGDTEGFGMVFIEANACGKPVIGGRCGGVIEAIQENKTGLLVDPYNVNDISQKIIYLLKNEQIANQMGKDGRKRALNEFEWETNIKANINKFKAVFLK